MRVALTFLFLAFSFFFIRKRFFTSLSHIVPPFIFNIIFDIKFFYHTLKHLISSIPEIIVCLHGVPKRYSDPRNGCNCRALSLLSICRSHHHPVFSQSSHIVGVDSETPRYLPSVRELEKPYKLEQMPSRIVRPRVHPRQRHNINGLS